MGRVPMYLKSVIAFSLGYHGSRLRHHEGTKLTKTRKHENKIISFSWFRGFVVSWFRGFVVSWFRGFVVSWSRLRARCRRCRVQYRTNDLVVPGAPTQIAREPVPCLFLARIRVRIQQRLGGDDEAGRADATLQRRVLEKLLLKRMQPLAAGDP